MAKSKLYAWTADKIKAYEDLRAEVERIVAKLDGARGNCVARNMPRTLVLDLAAFPSATAPNRARTDPTVTFKVTSAISGAGGMYNVKTFTPATGDVDTSGDLAESDIGTIADAEDGILLCLPELGAGTTHYLLETINTTHFSVYGEGTIKRYQADGKKVIHANMFWVGCV
jgi:hypothetical protein